MQKTRFFHQRKKIDEKYESLKAGGGGVPFVVRPLKNQKFVDLYTLYIHIHIDDRFKNSRTYANI